jgi:hypothetical protein
MMKQMRRKVEEEFKPMLQMLEAEMLPHGRLLAGAMDLVIGHYEETFRIMDEGNKKLCWYEFCLTPEIFLAMDIYPFLGESHPTLMTLGTPEVRCPPFLGHPDALESLRVWRGGGEHGAA